MITSTRLFLILILAALIIKNGVLAESFDDMKKQQEAEFEAYKDGKRTVVTPQDEPSSQSDEGTLLQSPNSMPTEVHGVSSGQASGDTLRKLTLDCFSTQNIKNRGSSNLIRVKFLDHNRKIVSAGASVHSSDKFANKVQSMLPFVSLKLTDAQCHGTKALGARFPAPSNKRIDVRYNIAKIKYIQIETDGDNALWLDRVIYKNKSGSGVQWGKNEGKGYCLSTETSDADGEWKDYVSSAGCTPCKEFVINTGQTNHSCVSEVGGQTNDSNQERVGGTPGHLFSGSYTVPVAVEDIIAPGLVLGSYWICPREKCLERKRQNGHFLMVSQRGELAVDKIEGGFEGIWEVVSAGNTAGVYLRNKKTRQYLVKDNNAIVLRDTVPINNESVIWRKRLAPLSSYNEHVYNFSSDEERLLILSSDGLVKISAPKFEKTVGMAQWKLIAVPDYVAGEKQFTTREGRTLNNYSCTPGLHEYLTFRADGLRCGGPDHDYKTTIKPACVTHDYCYHIPWRKFPITQRRVSDKHYCDRLFVNQAKNLCGADVACLNVVQGSEVGLKDSRAVRAFNDGQVWGISHCNVD